MVLITGGAGFVGSHLCRFLLAAGFGVRLLDNAPFQRAGGLCVDLLQGDIRDPIAVEHAMRGVVAVIHAAAAAPASVPEEVFSTNVAGTWTVLQTAVRKRVPRFVFLSSTEVYGEQAHRLMHEPDPLHGTGPQAESRIEAEHLCESARLSGMSVSILRLTEVTGPGQRGALAKLFQYASAGRRFLTVGSGRSACQTLHIEDLCQAIHLCLVMRLDLVNDTFNLGARAASSHREAFQALLDRAAHGKRVVRIPRGPAMAVLGLFERLVHSSRFSWIRQTAGQRSYVSVRHIDSRLGFRPRYSGTAALLREFDSYTRLRGPVDGKDDATPDCSEAI
jgi:nucleoside-diphosphate-sugar epimerase